MGVFLDDITNVQVSADASPVGDVAHSVAGLVIDNINRKFGLDPPLANDNMDVAWIPSKHEYGNILFAQLTSI